MNTHTNEHGSKNGGALVLAAIVVLAFSVLTLGLLKLQHTNALETVYVSQTQQAFWMAESGLEHVVQKLKWNPLYRANPWLVTTNDNRMSYTGRVVAVSTLPYSGKRYTVQSDGWVNGAQRTLQVQVDVTPGPVAHDAGTGGNFSSQNDVDGPMIVRLNGSMDTGNNATSVFNDYIMADPTNNITGNGKVAGVVQLPPGYVPPTLEDSNPFKSAIDDATVNGGPPTTNTLTKTIIYHTNTVDFGATDVSVPAGYTVIFPGDVDFGNNQAQLGQDVKVLAGGDVVFPNHSTVGDGSIIYAYDNIEFTTHGASDAVTLTGVSLLSERGDIIFNSQVTFDGLLFADNGTIFMSAGSDFDGVLVAAEGLEKSGTGGADVGSVNIGFDVDLINADVLGLAIFNWGTSVTLNYTSGTWREL